MKVPGLVDLQVNGYKGVDFSSAVLTEDDFVSACRGILEAGTAAFLPTIITSTAEVYQHNLDIMAEAMQRGEFVGRVLGIHVEGPFISPQDGARGAHNPKWVIKPDVEYLKSMVEWSGRTIKLITIAADVEEADQLARWCVSNDIVVLLGHQMADESDLERLRQAGAVALTHLGNGVPANLPRHKNPIWAGLANDGLSATLIADGHHLPPEVIKTFVRAKGVARCIVVSDCTALTGMPPGRHNVLGNDVILQENGKVYNPATGYLAGSSATILDCMNHLASLRLLSGEQLLTVGFFNPLKLLDMKPEQIEPGKGLFFDEQSNTFSIDE
ncbi:MAG: N-acetylglucosamine-6-phosphate deacetylase [Planctomycetota bacterium]|jgi:N-acetylglucosamine-6-phosphate deacetylase